MDYLNLRLTETVHVADELRAADREFKVQTDRLGEDDIKWYMIRHVADRILALAEHHDWLKSVCNTAFDRDLVIAEIKKITVEQRLITAEIKKVLDELEG